MTRATFPSTTGLRTRGPAAAEDVRPADAPSSSPAPALEAPLPRSHRAPPPTETPASAAGLAERFREALRAHPKVAQGVVMGATALPALVGAPTIARAQETPPTPAPSTTAREALFGPTPTTLAMRRPSLVPPLRLDPSLTAPSPIPSAPSRVVSPLPDRTDPSLLFPGRHADAPLGMSFGPTGELRLMVDTPDGRRLNILPSSIDLMMMGAIDTSPPRPAGAASTAPAPTPMDRLLVGVPLEVRAEPWRANFDDYFRARAAVSEIPTALAGMALQPVADHAYRVVDHIPAPIRRPFDRAVGLILDTAVSAPANALTTRIMGDTGALPSSAALPISAYPQIRNSCGEMMVGTWLKAHGVPIASGEVETQLQFFEGSNLLEDAELRRRGFSVISGPGTMQDLRAYVAHGYPVMVSVGWENGGGHYSVVTGYDDARQVLKIAGWRNGEVVEVPYSEFSADWGRHANLMMVAHPQRDARLADLRRRGLISREAQVQEGLSISDIWVTQRLEFFVEAAYRYRGTNDDLTIRLNVNTSERANSTADMFGGSIRYTHRFGPESELTIYAERQSYKGPADSTSLEAALRHAAIYVGGRHGPISARAGYEQGGFQAAFQAELNRRLFNLGAEARVSVMPDGNYAVFFGASGTF